MNKLNTWLVRIHSNENKISQIISFIHVGSHKMEVYLLSIVVYCY